MDQIGPYTEGKKIQKTRHDTGQAQGSRKTEDRSAISGQPALLSPLLTQEM
jgi:hypothetical protein